MAAAAPALAGPGGGSPADPAGQPLGPATQQQFGPHGQAAPQTPNVQEQQAAAATPIPDQDMMDAAKRGVAGISLEGVAEKRGELLAKLMESHAKRQKVEDPGATP